MSLSIDRKFETPMHPTWCAGCGNFGIWSALKNVLSSGHYQPHELVVVFGIGCSGNGANWIHAYGFHGLHGRALPLATGIALANHKVKVIVVGGDGDGYGEGLNHFIQTIRSNPNITYLVHNNQLYSLTKGQVSPTSAHGMVTDSTPYGNPDRPLNPLALALSAHCGFVARGFAGDSKHLEEVLAAAIAYKGFAYVDVLQPCVTFNHLNTYAWFYQRVQKIDAQHDVKNRLAAWQLATSIDETLDKLPIGIYYHVEQPTFQDEMPMLKAGPLVDQSIDTVDLPSLIKNFQ